jgi:hypothetical protein
VGFLHGILYGPWTFLCVFPDWELGIIDVAGILKYLPRPVEVPLQHFVRHAFRNEKRQGFRVWGLDKGAFAILNLREKKG